MNYSTAIFLATDAAIAVSVTYEPGDRSEQSKDYTFKTLDKTLKVDDYVVIPTGTRHGMTVCRIKEIPANVDYDSAINYKWIVAKVDRTEYDRIIEMEKKVIEEIKVADIEAKKEALRETLGKARLAGLKHLELASFKTEEPPTPIVPKEASYQQPAPPSNRPWGLDKDENTPF